MTCGNFNVDVAASRLQPQVLLLDEPRSLLDVSVQAVVLNLLEALRAQHGLTLVLVNHEHAVVTHLCGRWLVMQRGRAIETVSAADLAAHRVQADCTPQPDAGLTRLSAPHQHELSA